MSLLKLANAFERELSSIEEDFLKRNFPVTSKEAVKLSGTAGAVGGGLTGGIIGASTGITLGALLDNKLLRKTLPVPLGAAGGIIGAKAGGSLGTLLGNVQRNSDEMMLRHGHSVFYSAEQEDVLKYINMLGDRLDTTSHPERAYKLSELEQTRYLGKKRDRIIENME